MAAARLIRIILAGAAVLCAAQAQSAARVDVKRMLNADKEAGQWMTHSRTYDEQYYSPLKRINDGNVGKLGLAFFVDLPTNQNVETTPLMVDGVLYVTLPWSKVMALDARTGKQLWLHDPKVAGAWNINICCGVDLATGRPIEVPDARPNLTNKVFNLAPGPAGGHAWQSMSYSPITKLVYIPATTHWQLTGPFDLRQKYLADNPDTPTGFTGRLMAWDPVAQREVWRSEEFINPTGGVQVTAGALATAGNLVFHGNLPKREFAAYRATDGKRLWSFGTKTAVLANPISYEVRGEQYVAIAVGGPMPGGYYAPNGARLLVFKQGGKTALPDVPAFTEAPIAPPPQFADAEAIRRGAQVFEAQCQLCHGRNGAARSTFPDLRRAPALHSQPLLDAIVLQGTLAERGMGSFREYLKDGDTVALRAYLISIAQAAIAPAPAAAPAPAR